MAGLVNLATRNVPRVFLSSYFARSVQTSTQSYKDMKETDMTLFLPQETITVDKHDDVSIISYTPKEQLKSRTVRIFSPPKNSMQSGTFGTHKWQIQFDTRDRWENPMMGWTATADVLSMTTVDFMTKEDAVEYCERNGWSYYVDERKEMHLRPKSYSANFSWNKRTRTTTK